MKVLSRGGFTLIELIITIAIIAILAGLAIVSYDAVRANARDAAVKSGAQKIAEAIELWSISTRDQPTTASIGFGAFSAMSGTNTTACYQTGWVAEDQNDCSIEGSLVDTGHLPADFIASLPGNGSDAGSGHTYRLQPCSAIPNHYVLYYSLDNPSQQDIDNFDRITLEQCSNDLSERRDYNMQGARLLDLTSV